MCAEILLAQVADLFVWYNAVFVTFFALGFVFTLLQLIGLGGEAGVGADADVDADVDLDADADVDADMDADADVDADADLDADADADAHLELDGGHAAAVSGAGAFAQMLGLGKVPLSISLMVLCYSVGLIGWLSNELIAPRFGEPAAFFPFSLLIALVGGAVTLRLVSSFMARCLPSYFSTALGPAQLVGTVGTSVLPISERFGRASVYDKYGTLHVVQCCVRPGAQPIPKGQKVVLVKYIRDRDVFIVGLA